MNNRLTTRAGRFTAKRGNTKIGTIEKQYNVDLGVRSDMKLKTFLKREGFPTLSKMISGKKINR